jgi:hypothetical protein
MTGLRWAYEVPKFPWTMLVSHVKNCSMTGLLRPICSRTRSMVASSAMSPTMMRTGSPGTMFSTKNVMAEMAKTTPTASRILLMR